MIYFSFDANSPLRAVKNSEILESKVLKQHLIVSSPFQQNSNLNIQYSEMHWTHFQFRDLVSITSCWKAVILS